MDSTFGFPSEDVAAAYPCQRGEGWRRGYRQGISLRVEKGSGLRDSSSAVMLQRTKRRQRRARHFVNVCKRAPCPRPTPRDRNAFLQTKTSGDSTFTPRQTATFALTCLDRPQTTSFQVWNTLPNTLASARFT